MKIETTTKRVWEVSDINYDDPIHGALHGMILIVMLDQMLLRGEIEKAPTDEAKLEVIKKFVVSMLNYLEQSDVAIVKKEVVPEHVSPAP